MRIFHVATAADLLGGVTVTFPVLLLVAHTKAQDGDLPPSVTFLMEAFLAVGAVSTGACLAVSGYLRQTDSAGAAASRVPSHG